MTLRKAILSWNKKYPLFFPRCFKLVEKIWEVVSTLENATKYVVRADHSKRAKVLSDKADLIGEAIKFVADLKGAHLEKNEILNGLQQIFNTLYPDEKQFRTKKETIVSLHRRIFCFAL